MEYLQLLVVAILAEAIWENIKMVYQNNKISVSMIGSLVLSIVICLLGNVDVFPVVGIEMKLPIVGSILTGIICSRGANFISDLFTKLKNLKGESENGK